MSYVSGFQIASYRTGFGWGSMSTSPGADYPPRYIGLYDTVTDRVWFIFFPEPTPLPAPTHNVWTMRTSEYADVHRLLQTEQPLFVEMAWDTPNGPLLGVYMGTMEPEPPGEGPTDLRQPFALLRP